MKKRTIMQNAQNVAISSEYRSVPIKNLQKAVAKELAAQDKKTIKPRGRKSAA